MIGGGAATAGAVLIALCYAGKDRVFRSGYHDWARQRGYPSRLAS